jgi:hypothetical protein
VLLGLVRAQLDAGDAVGAIDTRAEAVQAAVEVDDPDLVTQALIALDRPMVWLPRPMGQVNDEMVQQLERALLATSEPELRCMLSATLAVELYAPGQELRCDELTAESVRLAEQIGDARRTAFAVNARVVATAFPRRERERAEAADRLVEIGRGSALPSVELAGHQLACRLRLQLFQVRVADEHARHARRMAAQLRLPLPALQQQLWDCSRRALDGDLPAALRMVDELEALDWPWWGREAMLATTRLMLHLRRGGAAARPCRASEPTHRARRTHPRVRRDGRGRRGRRGRHFCTARLDVAVCRLCPGPGRARCRRPNGYRVDVRAANAWFRDDRCHRVLRRRTRRRLPGRPGTCAGAP